MLKFWNLSVSNIYLNCGTSVSKTHCNLRKVWLSEMPLQKKEKRLKRKRRQLDNPEPLQKSVRCEFSSSTNGQYSKWNYKAIKLNSVQAINYMCATQSAKKRSASKECRIRLSNVEKRLSELFKLITSDCTYRLYCNIVRKYRKESRKACANKLQGTAYRSATLFPILSYRSSRASN